MARNEDGEFELILGNRQLLSVFFIVVVLLGLCFLMGYVIGRNSAPPVNAENVPPPETPAGTSTAAIPPATTAPPPDSAPAPEAATRTEPAATTPQKSAETPALPAPKPPPAPAATAPETKQSAKLPPLPPIPGSQPPAGAYLQLSATLRAEAEAYVDRLRAKGFSATLAQVPGQDRYRVLVGPFPDNPAEIQRMRARLNEQSFPGNEALARRY